MKSLINNLSKGLTALVFVALLAVNVQIGTGSSLLVIGESPVSAVEAAPCDQAPDYCVYIEFPNGERWVRVGEAIVVTDEKIARQ
jgi:hypothetical protein